MCIRTIAFISHDVQFIKKLKIDKNIIDFVSTCSWFGQQCTVLAERKAKCVFVCSFLVMKWDLMCHVLQSVGLLSSPQMDVCIIMMCSAGVIVMTLDIASS